MLTWIYLIIAGLFEVVWSSFMKLSRGFTVLPYTIATVVGMIISFVLLAKATSQIDLAIAYPVWTGIGAVGAVLAGVVLFREHLSLTTMMFVGLLIISIVGIKVTSGR
ncbi:DMT family transporter [Lacticaseibacillus sharpeae]|nr:multidrug efflux SMR transporter [Lacticaseibacillus sharpeae]